MWGIYLKSYERESFTKSFLLFFSVQFVFLSIVIYQNYQKNVHKYEMSVGHSMMQCHLKLKCDKFQTVTLKESKGKTLHTLHIENEIYMLFEKEGYFIKMTIEKKVFFQNLQKIKSTMFINYALYSVVLLLISIFFALYATYPLKKALQLNDEFVKDILHDFNTPLSSIKINYKILKKLYGENDALKRSDEAIENIITLQHNLHAYLNKSKLKNSDIFLNKLVQERVLYFKTLYPEIDFIVELKNLQLFTNEDAFTRVLDNIISNAGKYNKKNGSIKIFLKQSTLVIKDSGKGIKNPKKIFERYYKESEVGIGIGLHVVKKLCDELKIDISLDTQVDKGTSFSLDLSRLKYIGNSQVTLQE